MPNTLCFLPDPVFLYISEDILILRRSDARLTLSPDSSYRIKATADQNPRRNRDMSILPLNRHLKSPAIDVF